LFRHGIVTRPRFWPRFILTLHISSLYFYLSAPALAAPKLLLPPTPRATNYFAPPLSARGRDTAKPRPNDEREAVRAYLSQHRCVKAANSHRVNRVCLDSLNPLIRDTDIFIANQRRADCV
jgi:hypothetical protein